MWLGNGGEPAHSKNMSKMYEHVLPLAGCYRVLATEMAHSRRGPLEAYDHLLESQVQGRELGLDRN